MPTLILENAPAEFCERVRELAAEYNQPIKEVTAQVQVQPRLPDSPSPTGEIPAPLSLPRHGAGEYVNVVPGGKRLPNPPTVADER